MKTKRPTPGESPGLYFAGQTAQRARRAAEAQYVAEREAKVVEEDTLLSRSEAAVHWLIEGFPDLAARLSEQQVAGLARGLARALVSTAGGGR